MNRNNLHRRIDRIERQYGGSGPSALALAWCRKFGGDPDEFPYETLEQLVLASYELEGCDESP